MKEKIILLDLTNETGFISSCSSWISVSIYVYIHIYISIIIGYKLSIEIYMYIISSWIRIKYI